MDKVKVGVIGVGFLGEKHAAMFSQNPRSDLIGIYDIDDKRARKIARKLKTRAYSSCDELLGQVDAASVVTPTKAHVVLASKALSLKKHVLVEKPMTVDVSEADLLLELARKNNVILQVGHVERFNAAVRKASELIKNPRFIEVHRLGPYSFRSTEIDVVLDLMIHDIDIILCFVASKIKEISAYGTPVLSKTNDIANVKLVFENKCIANLTASRLTLQSMRKIRIFDNEKYLSIDYMKQEAECYSRKKEIKTHPKSLKDLIDRKKIRINKNQPLADEIDSFIESVRFGREPMVSGEDGREAIAIVEEIICQIKKY